MRRVITLQTDKHKDYLSLIKDPQSIPLNIPLQPDNFVRKEVKKGLMNIVINGDIRCLFTQETQAEQAALVDDLIKIVPCNPRLLSKLYALSNIGLQEKWAGEFANTRSIQQTAFQRWSSEVDVINSVRELENKYIGYLLKKKMNPYVIESGMRHA